MNNQIVEKCNELHDEISSLRHAIHANPELGFHEKFATKTIENSLKQAGLEIVPLDLDVGVVGLLQGTRKNINPLVTALRADIDALPIQELTGLDYSSTKPGTMHACGHDGNLAVMVGVAHVLSQIKDQFSGVVKFIFQPAEELLEGARKMISCGVLENPSVDYIFACHSWPDLPVGKIGTFTGNYMAAADSFEIKIMAPGTHGGYPHRSPDPVTAAAHAIQAINGIVSREIDAADTAVISVCTLNGGNSFNVIPNTVLLSGTIRSHSSQVQKKLHSALTRVVAGVASTHDCQCETNIKTLVPTVDNSPKAIDIIKQAVKNSIGEEWLEELDAPCMGSEDFSLYLEKVPKGAFIRVGNTSIGGPYIPLHNNRYNYNDQSLPHAMAVIAQTVLDLQGRD